jgi:hypothetical protein
VESTGWQEQFLIDQRQCKTKQWEEEVLPQLYCMIRVPNLEQDTLDGIVGRRAGQGDK